MAIAFTLTTSGTVARRNLALNFMDGDGNVWNSTPIAQGIPGGIAFSQYGDLVGGDMLQSGTELANEGTATAPAALTTIATLANLPKGIYSATVYLTIAGTPAQGTDNNNVQLDNGASTVYEILDNEIAAGLQTFGPFEIEVGTLGTVSVRNIGVATAGAIYSATLNLIPTSVQGGFQFPDFLFKSGWQVQIALGNPQTGDQLSQIYFYTERYPSTDMAIDKTDAETELATLLLDYLGR